MFIINWAGVEFRWLPLFIKLQKTEYRCLELRWLGVQLCWYNSPAANKVSDLLNGKP